MRTIKQIALSVCGEDTYCVLVVATDGTLWRGDYTRCKLEWERLPDLPQEATSTPGDVQKEQEAEND